MMLLATPECYGVTDCDGSPASVSALFRKYEEAGFLYPEKRSLLAPYIDTIHENWQRLLSSENGLMKAYIYTDGKAWGSGSYFLHSNGGWCGHHLVSIGHPMASRAVTLAAGLDIMRNRSGTSYHTWFRPTTRLTGKVSGSKMVQRLGHTGCEVRPFYYFLIPREHLPRREAVPDGYVIAEEGAGNSRAVYEFVSRVRGEVYAMSQGLDNDILLERVNASYRRVGLYRYRRIWIVRQKADNAPAAVVMAHRGPLGMNFSFLENAVDILCSESLAANEARSLISALLAIVAREAYLDFPPPFLIVTADGATACHFDQSGIVASRRYSRMAVLSNRWRDYCEHVDKVYESLDRMLLRRV